MDRKARMKALYDARVQRGVCPCCESVPEDRHVYCRGCRRDRAELMQRHRYLTLVTVHVSSSHTTA